MTWGNRFRLVFGSIAVVALVSVLTLVFNQRQHTATSSTATIAAINYPVGVTYSGTVIDVAVQDGDKVTAGDALVSVRSASLLHDLRQNLVTPTSLGYSVTKNGTIRFTSAVDGTVTGLTARVGAFVQAGSTLLTVAKAGSLFVTAKVVLTPADYGRLSHGSVVDVLLPNQRTIEGRVRDISVTTVGSEAQAQLTVSSPALVDGSDNGIVQSGTPVSATVHLRDDGPLAGVADKGVALLRQIGL